MGENLVLNVEASPTEKGTPVHSASQVKILYVEDSKVTAYSLTTLLSEIAPSYQITHVETLREVLEILPKETFDLILLDLGLPDSFGLETFDAVSQATNLPIIVLSSLNEEEAIREALRKGARNFLLKGAVNAAMIAEACQRVKGATDIEKVLVAYDKVSAAVRDQELSWEKLSWEMERGLRKVGGS